MSRAARLTADVVIVGAGSAGCVAAAALARLPGRVVLIESGPITPPPAAVTDLRTLPIGPGAARVRRYPEARGRSVVRGAGLGGSSAVNGGYFLRGHRADYDGWPWSGGEIARALDALDGGDGDGDDPQHAPEGGGAMRVRPFADAELGPVATAFERWAAAAGGGAPGSVWPRVGVNRVRSNRAGGHRVSAAHVLLRAAPRVPFPLRATATGLVLRGGRAAGVLTDRGRIDAGAVILAAGTLGTAELLAPHLGRMPVHEHAERIVRFTPRVPLPAAPLLQSVLHTPEGLEIRCYSDDFASYIPGLHRTGVPVGVADMTAPTAGTITPGAVGVTVDLGEPDAPSLARMDAGVAAVREMLGSAAFAHLVEPGSVRADPVVGISMHAWGSLPAGARPGAGGAATGPDGGVAGIENLWVVDGSILPGPLRSGPHATVMAVAALASARTAAVLGAAPPDGTDPVP